MPPHLFSSVRKPSQTDAGQQGVWRVTPFSGFFPLAPSASARRSFSGEIKDQPWLSLPTPLAWPWGLLRILQPAAAVRGRAGAEQRSSPTQRGE